jgi:hypothetical protein
LLVKLLRQRIAGALARLLCGDLLAVDLDLAVLGQAEAGAISAVDLAEQGAHRLQANTGILGALAQGAALVMRLENDGTLLLDGSDWAAMIKKTFNKQSDTTELSPQRSRDFLARVRGKKSPPHDFEDIKDLQIRAFHAILALAKSFPKAS